MAGLLGKGANKDVRASNHIGSIGRTKVNRPFNFRSTFNAGKLIPFWCDEVYPGENISVRCSELVRSITPLGPTMDNSYLDLFFFFVPNRLVWDHWEEFIAEYNKEAWARNVKYTTPKVILGENSFISTSEAVPTTKNDWLHSFMDYLPGAMDVVEVADWCMEGGKIYVDMTEEGADAKVAATKVSVNKLIAISALYPRAYVKIWNDWFRDENLQDEYELYTGDNDQEFDDFAFNLLDPDALPSAAKYHNRFTSALPAPVKGPDVLIPMNDLQVGIIANSSYDLANNINIGIPAGSSGSSGDVQKIYNLVTNTSFGDSKPVVANNVSNTIRMLRLATQTELLLARDARGGTRYVESLLSHWSVTNGDARLQRSEYLGSRHIPLQTMSVTNTAQGASSPLGNVGGQSVTKDSSHYFSKAFSEYGIVFCVGCVRTNISYSSGTRKMYQRFGRFDYIWPEFRHIGDVPCYTREIETHYNLLDLEDTVFGYVPYGSELREGYNFNNGLFRHKAEGNLAYLTYQEKYIEDNPPYLSSDWIKQPSDIVSDTLVDQNGPQFYALFQLDETAVIPLDPTSDPGLMDHF